MIYQKALDDTQKEYFGDFFKVDNISAGDGGPFWFRFQTITPTTYHADKKRLSWGFIKGIQR